MKIFVDVDAALVQFWMRFQGKFHAFSSRNVCSRPWMPFSLIILRQRAHQDVLHEDVQAVGIEDCCSSASCSLSLSIPRAFSRFFAETFMQECLTPFLASLFVVKGVDRDVKRSCMWRSRCATLSSAAWTPSGSSMTSTELVHSSSLTATQFREKELHSQGVPRQGTASTARSCARMQH